MPKPRTDKPKQPASRPSVANMRVAASRPAKPQVPEHLEPADSFDLGDETPDAESAAGVLLGRKASAASRRKKEAKRKAAAPSGAVPSAASSPIGSGPGDCDSRNDATTTSYEGRPFPRGKSAKRPKLAAERRPKPTAEGQPKPAAEGKQKRSAKGVRKKIFAAVGIVFIAAFVVAAVVAGLWAWNAWFRYDDAADIQGGWNTGNPAVSVTIDATAIHMPDSVDFAYTIDTREKTISFSFGELSGGGSYEFSEDRTMFTITELDGSQTVFTRVSSFGTEDSAQEGQQSSNAESSSSVDDENQQDAASDSSSAVDSSEDEAQQAEVSAALESTSGESTPGSNAVAPGSASLSDALSE